MSVPSSSPAAAPGADPSAAASASRTLLLVDDEPAILESLAGVFTGLYYVVKAPSGTAALALLKAGLKPHVILSDNRMPDIPGIEFLLQSAALAPDAVRAMMTAYSDLREILAAISRGHIYLYIAKPWQVVELLQAVRLCFQQYDLNMELRRAAAEVETQNGILRRVQHNLAEANKGYIDQNHVLVSQLVETSRAFASALEPDVYHVPHGEFVARLSRAVAYMAGFSESGIAEIEVAAHLHDIGKAGLPPAIRAADPASLSGADRVAYEAHVDRGVRLLEGMRKFGSVLETVAQHHERPDGHGFPRRLADRDVSRESQIVALADFYHNQAYRLTPDEQHRRRAGQKVELSYEERQARQASASARFAEVEKAYDPRIVQSFHAVSASGTVDGFRLAVA